MSQMKDKLANSLLDEARKYGTLIRPDSIESQDLIFDQKCPGCKGKLRWHLPDGIYGRVFFVCDSCDRWFFAMGAFGAWEVIDR